MKKKIFGGIAIMAIVAFAAFNVNFGAQSDNLSAINLANVEALAQSESGGTYKYVTPGPPGSGVACTCSGSGSLSCCG